MKAPIVVDHVKSNILAFIFRSNTNAEKIDSYVECQFRTTSKTKKREREYSGTRTVKGADLVNAPDWRALLSHGMRLNRKVQGFFRASMVRAKSTHRTN